MSVSKGIGSLTGTISAKGSLTGTLTVPLRVAEKYDIYEGEYTVVPSDETQVLQTADKVLKQDITVEAGGYGLPEGTEMATDGDLDEVIEEVFGEEADSPGYNDDDIATDEELKDVIEDVFN